MRSGRAQSQRPLPPASTGGDPDRRPHRALGLLLLLAALLFVAGIGWQFWPRGDGNRGGVLADVARTAPSATTVVTAVIPTTASPTAATLAPSPSLVPEETPTPSPVAAPTASPLPRATPRPTPRPTPRASPGRTLPARDPAETVARFYHLVEAHHFREAAAMWSARMRAQYPPSGYIDGRFAHTTRIVLHRDRVVSVNSRAGSAVVAVDLTEYRDNGAPRRFVGRWDLVLVRGSWLLDRPHF